MAPTPSQPPDGERLRPSSFSPRLLLRVALLTLVGVGLIGGLHLYLAVRLLPGAWGLALAGVLFASIPAGFYAGRRRPSGSTRAVLWLSHVWMGLFFILLCTVAALDAGRGAASLLGDGTYAWDRLWRLAALGIGFFMAGYGVLRARGRPRIRRVDLPVQDLGEGMVGLRVVQVSDIHIGQTLRRPFLERMVERVNALEPDVIAVTGDLVDGFVHSLRDEVAPLAGLKAKLGVFYVPGNHEFYYGGASWMAEVRRLGLTVVENEHRVLERGGAQLVIAGVSDHDGGHFGERHACRPDLALAGAPPEVPRILLAHQPRSAKLIRKERVDLQLSGHTHAGQIFPFNFLVKLQQPAVSGLHEVNGVRVYTHAGTGYWGPPMRIGAPPEIAVLTLQRPR